jgi:hypothetical protein
MYLVRTKFPAGFRQGPGRRPHDQVGTVLSGTLYIGFGEQFNEQQVVPVPPGHTWTIPARRPYFLWAKEGDVLLQVMGNG